MSTEQPRHPVTQRFLAFDCEVDCQDFCAGLCTPDEEPERTENTHSLPKPWPRKPPKGERCDASVGSDVDFLGAPVVIRCPAPATETCWWGMEAWLCEPHAESLAAKGNVRRNPRAEKDRSDD